MHIDLTGKSAPASAADIGPAVARAIANGRGGAVDPAVYAGLPQAPTPRRPALPDEGAVGIHHMNGSLVP